MYSFSLLKEQATNVIKEIMRSSDDQSGRRIHLLDCVLLHGHRSHHLRSAGQPVMVVEDHDGAHHDHDA